MLSRFFHRKSGSVSITVAVDEKRIIGIPHDVVRGIIVFVSSYVVTRLLMSHLIATIGSRSIDEHYTHHVDDCLILAVLFLAR